MGPLELQMYVWAITWLLLVVIVAVAFFNTED
ncbi:hypothetical protein P4b_00048 [Klebsiella phage VLCpiP4b]|nr:hypothetical protein P4b_00048 [Klebsiella phage VLCpiP4b]